MADGLASKKVAMKVDYLEYLWIGKLADSKADQPVVRTDKREVDKSAAMMVISTAAWMGEKLD